MKSGSRSCPIQISAIRPDQTQKLEPSVETTQRTDDSIRRLQEAKRILQKTSK